MPSSSDVKRVILYPHKAPEYLLFVGFLVSLLLLIRTITYISPRTEGESNPSGLPCLGKAKLKIGSHISSTFLFRFLVAEIFHLDDNLSTIFDSQPGYVQNSPFFRLNIHKI